MSIASILLTILILNVIIITNCLTKGEIKMGLFEELKQRGLIAQITNEEKVRDLINNQKITFYIGFDPTADSLHVGSFVQMIVMAHMQKAGHTPIALFGGGTGMIGDPSGKTDMRKMLSHEQIDYNINCFKKQMSKFIDFSDNKAIMVNNGDWLSNLNYIDFLRDVGIHFSVNRMLSFECYKQRLERGLSFFELNYMIMQSYDFLYLNKNYNCILELGGDDQWSNIIGGVELVRRKEGKDVYGMTFSLLTTSEGKKMGKTENGAVWLNPNKTSPFDFYQYWRNIDDKDVIKCLKMLTFIPLEKIEKLSLLKGQEINKAKEILAFELTSLVHGNEAAKKAQEAAKSLFDAGESSDSMPTTKIQLDLFKNNCIPIIDILILSKIATSKGEARRLIQQGGISIIIKNEARKVDEISSEISSSNFHDGFIVIKKGKKTFHKVELEN